MTDFDQAVRDNLHLSQAAMASLLGVTIHAVRASMERNGLRTRHAERKAELEALKAIPKPSDAELVAIYLSTRKVTQLPPGQACGLTQWEGALWVAGPNSSGDWKTAQRNRNKNAGTLR